MKLSVIIPFYENLIEALNSLNSLRHFAGEYRDSIEWLVQDDASPSVFAPALFPNEIASVERNARNLGFAGNCNAAANRATGDVLLFINQDVYATGNLSEWWYPAIKAAFEDLTVGVVGAKLVFPNGGIQSAGGLYDAMKHPYHRCLGYSDTLNAEVNTPRQVSWVTGAALAIRRNLFVELGGFDAAYISYFEDVDLCVRARQLGWHVWYEPRCAFVHKVGTTGGSPHFMNSAQRFKSLWVDTGKISADSNGVYERYW